MELKTGLGVLEEAIPAPSAGCRMNSGAIAVTIPMTSAGSNVMARRMNTSRAALDRLLDPNNASVTLQTLSRAAHAVGRDLRIELV